jgi:hypothetical protein
VYARVCKRLRVYYVSQINKKQMKGV